MLIDLPATVLTVYPTRCNNPPAMKNAIRIALVMLAIAIPSYFGIKQLNTNKPSSPAATPVINTATAAYNEHVIDTAVSLLKSGYLILRTGIGADSYILSQMNLHDKTYSHCGIVMIENGKPYIYHSIGGEDNPDERLRRDEARFFCSPQHNLGLAIVSYDLDSTQVSALHKVVEDYYRLRPKFDMKFDLTTDDQLYCAEFVYKAMNKTMKDTAYIKTNTLYGHRYVGVDNLFINPHAHIIWKTKFK